MARVVATLAFLATVHLAAAPRLVAQAVGVLDARSIATVRIETATPGEWTSQGPNERSRVVKLAVVVERVFRGPLHAREKLLVDAVQTESTGRVSAPRGPWSGKTLTKGVRYVVFANKPDEPIRVTDAAESTGVDLALAFEQHRWPLGELRRRTGDKRRLLGVVFAEYLAAKLPAAVSGGVEQWNSIASFAEDRELTPAFRALAARAVLDAVLMVSPAPDAIINRTAVMAFRVLACPDYRGFHDRLVGTYLPNLIGQEGSEPKRSARQIFASYPDDQSRAAGLLATMPPTAARVALEAWISGKS